MAIRTVITRGFGNGTFNGTIALVVTRGYTIGAAVVAFNDAFAFTVYFDQARANDLYIDQARENVGYIDQTNPHEVNI